MKLNTCYFVLHSGSKAASALLFCSLACYIFEKCYIVLYWAEKKIDLCLESLQHNLYFHQ